MLSLDSLISSIETLLKQHEQLKLENQQIKTKLEKQVAEHAALLQKNKHITHRLQQLAQKIRDQLS